MLRIVKLVELLSAEQALASEVVVVIVGEAVVEAATDVVRTSLTWTELSYQLSVKALPFSGKVRQLIRP